MKITGHLVYLLLFLLVLSKMGISQSRQRRENQALVRTISGALLYLEDRQLRLGKKEFGNFHPRTRDKNFYLMSGQWHSTPKLVDDRKTAVWRSWIAFLPKRFRWGPHAFMLAPDDNLFLLLSTAYPLYLFTEKEDAAGYLLAMKNKIQNRTALYKRGRAYNFWPKMPGVYGKKTRTGPPFIPVRFIHRLTSFCLNPRHDSFCEWLTYGQDVVPKTWFQTIRSPQNTTGEDAFFNIPNDADDTSLAVALQQLWYHRFKTESPLGTDEPDTEALKYLGRFRDTARIKEDGRDAWKGTETNAYLTWLKPEQSSLFGNPDSGIMPLGVNNVDAVINANVLFVLGLTGIHDERGEKAAIHLLEMAVSKHPWSKTALYYPQDLALSYAVTRAYRDGGVRNRSMQRVVSKVLVGLLEMQNRYSDEHPGKAGGFPGGDDHTIALSTALALSSLLNIGENIAKKEGLLSEYRQAVVGTVHYLIHHKKVCGIRYADSFNSVQQKGFGLSNRKAFYWKAGLAFSSSYRDLAHWRSRAYTVAMVLEGLTKYLLEYDKHDSGIQNGPRVLLLSYPVDALRHPMTFEIQPQNRKSEF